MSSISAAVLTSVLLVFETASGKDASTASAAITGRKLWEHTFLPRGSRRTHTHGKPKSDYYGLEDWELDVCKKISHVLRKEWGARPPKAENYLRVNGGVSYVFYHHTGREQCFSNKTCSQIILKWQLVHQKTQGWDDIGYNFIIGSNGMVFVGRGWNKIGAHTVGFNNKSVSFGFVGDYSRQVPNDLMLQAAQNLIECGIKLGKIRATFSLHGQSDANCRDCPGKAFHASMKRMPHFGGRLPGYICTPSPWN
ncbi:peptidoglycan-recognition protein SC2-like [Ixodes scapularis]